MLTCVVRVGGGEWIKKGEAGEAATIRAIEIGAPDTTTFGLLIRYYTGS